jgi:outer membrane protein assembly factor BamB
MRRKVWIAAIVVMAMIAGLLGWRLWPREYIKGPREPLSWNGTRSVGPGIDVLAQDDDRDGPIFGDVKIAPRNDGLRAFRLADGATYWTYRRRWAPWLTGPMTAFVRLDEQHVAVVWCDDRVSAIDVRTGTITWSLDLPRGPKEVRCHAENDETAEASWDAAVGDPAEPVLIVQRGGRIDALDARTGRPRWHSATFQGTPLEVFGRTAVARDEHGVTMLDTRNGRPLWSPRGCPSAYEVVVGLGDHVAACDRSALTVYQAADGRRLWRIPQAATIDPWQIARAGELLLIRNEEALTAYQAGDGRVAWRTRLPIIDKTLPVVMADGQLAYTQSADSTLIQLDARTGRIIDTHDFAGGSIVMASMHNGMLQILLGGRTLVIG